MLITLASAPHQANPYVEDTFKNLPKSVTIHRGIEYFWQQPQAGILHIQWPEELNSWYIPSSQKLNLLQQQLQAWKRSNARIVVTKHDLRPHHQSRGHQQLQRWCQIVESHADAMVHLEHPSLEMVKKDAQHLSKEIIHTVIAHPVQLKPARAAHYTREDLQIPHGHRIILIPGNVRHSQERRIILKLSQLLTGSYSMLVPMFGGHARPPWIDSIRKRLQWAKHMRNATNRLNLHAEIGSVSPQDLHDYGCLADLVLIPRWDVLNSGIPAFAAAYGLPVIGPATGNIRALLDNWQQQSFQDFTPREIIKCIEQAKSAPIIPAEYTQSVVAGKHFELYQALITDHQLNCDT